MASSPQLFAFRNPFVPAKSALPASVTKGEPESRDTRKSARQPCRAPKPVSDILSENASSSAHEPRDLEPQKFREKYRSCLLIFGAACFLAGHGRLLLQGFWRCLVGGMAADVLALLCLVAFLEPAVKRLLQDSWTKVSPVCTLMYSMPQIVSSMSSQMTAMLEEIQAMRSDVKAMKAKTNWLPGGMVA